MYREYKISLKPFEIEIAIQKGTLWFYLNLGTYHETGDKRIALDIFYNGKAKYIVSGDKHLLALKEFKGIKIVTVNKMLAILR